MTDRLGRVTSVRTMTKLLKEKEMLEKRLKQSYSSSNFKSERVAISRIKQNSKSFFSFARARQKTRSRIGPFLDPGSGKPDNRKQYNSVFTDDITF